MAAFEVMVANPAVRNLVREGKTNQLRNVLVTGQRTACRRWRCRSTARRDGLVDYDEALAVSLYPKELVKPTPVSAVMPGQAKHAASA